MASFSAGVGEWAAKSKARTEAVYRRSVEILADEMGTTNRVGGKVPIDTGNLARSVLASTDSMPKTSEVLSTGSTVGVVTATLRLDQVVYLGYQAVYARRQNYGFVGTDSLGRLYNQQGAHFVEYAISMWPTIVKLASEDLQLSVEARKK